MKPIHMIKYSSLGLVVLMAGCATSKPALSGQLDPQMGAAVKANIAMQAVAPTAVQKANTFIPADPARTGLARKNYKENLVPEPERINQASGDGGS